MNNIILKGLLCIVILSMYVVLFVDGLFPRLEDTICNKVMPRVGAICFAAVFIILLLHFTGVWRLSVWD